MIRIKCKTIKKVFGNGNYQIFGCILEEKNNEIKLNDYNNFTLIDEMGIISLDKIYDIIVVPQDGKYGVSYKLDSLPTLSIGDIKDITPEMELDILNSITTKTLAKNVNDAYPDYIRLILTNKDDEIDLKKIKGVKEHYHNLFKRLINQQFKYYYIMQSNRHYDLKMGECKDLCTKYGTIEKSNEMLTKHPYLCLINICGRGFYKADKEICKYDNKWIMSDERTEFMMLDILERNETTGSTYMSAVDLGYKINEIDNRVIDKVKNIALASEQIYYDPIDNIIAKLSTYIAECTISDFIKEKLKQSDVLDWNWQKFKKIKDGILTDEQSNVLKTFCEHNFSILDSPSGTGKTSTLMALLHMCEYYHMDYICLTATGKASARLTEQTGRPSSTIHRATFEKEIYQDVVIIDEYSMLSVDLVCMIISAISNPDARIFLLGDTAQIPSIGKGRIAKDLLYSDLIPSCQLTKCFRFKEGGASYISELSRMGKFYLTDEQCELDTFTLGEKKDYTFIKSNSTVEQIVDEYLKLYNKGIKADDICVLTPYNKGILGATNINNLIQEKINPPKKNDKIMKTWQNNVEIHLRAGDLIMNTKNNYSAMTLESYELIKDNKNLTKDDVPHVAIFNGQIGKVLTIDDKVLTAQIENEIIVFDKIDSRNLLLSYATNPYKFQGSQCKNIINVVSPNHKRSLNNQLLYTTQTRLVDRLIEIVHIPTLIHTINTSGDDKRNTFLLKLLLDNKVVQ